MIWTLAQSIVFVEDLVPALMLMVVGMLVVFAALLLLLAAIWSLDRIAGERKPVKTAATEAVATEAAAPTDALATDDPRLIAILTAAATATLKRSVHVTHVKQIHHPDHGWVDAGRHDVMSHHSPHLHRRRH